MKTRLLKIVLPILILVFLFTLARAIQTPEVEIGNSGAYDGTVKIRRDSQGRMLFSDSEVTNPVTLNDLRYSGVDHGLMLGLADDDHAQYHTAARHAAAHSSAFNGALAIPADNHGNLTLGAHLLDSVIHPLPGVYEPAFAAGTTAQYRRGDKTWQPLNQAAVAGLTAADTPTLTGLTLSGGGLSASGSMTLTTAAGGAGFTRFGGIWNWQDVDAANASRMTLDSANGNLWASGSLTSALGYLFSGVDGAVGGQVRVYSPVSGKYGMFYGASDGAVDIGAAGTYLRITAGANSDIQFNAGGTFYWRDVDASGANRMTLDSATGNLWTGGTFSANGDINNVTGAYKTGGVTRLAANGAAVLTQADVDNLRLDGNTLSSTNGNGNIALAPNGTGQVTVSGDLAVGSGGAKMLLNGQRVIPGRNLLDNPDFNIWQRNVAQTCAAGGNAGGTILWPIPGTLGTGADRWQISRSKTDMATTVSRAALPAALPTALYCLKNEYFTGTDCYQFIHQTVPRDATAALRGKWVTFAVSHYLNGAGGGNVAIYKFVGSTPSALVNYAFTATANSWDRLAVAAQVPTDADFLCVSVKSNLNSAGPTVAYLANAVLVEGRFVASTEKAADPAESSVPPQPRHPAEDLERCQRYYEKGALAFSSYAPGTDTSYHYSMVHFNTAKAGTPAIALSNINGGGLSDLVTEADPFPAYTAGQSWPQGFRITMSGSAAGEVAVDFYADWIAACPEPN